jgi:hypothetical protein
MGGWINDIVNTLLGAVIHGITLAVQAGLNWVLGLLATTLFASPDVTALPQVQYTSGQAQLVANAGMGLIVTVAGALAMTHGSVQDRYSVKELLPRLLIGFTLANLAIPIVRAAITFANAVTAAMVGARFTSTDSFGQIRRIVIGAATDQNLAMWVVVLQVLVLVMLVVVVFTWLGRLTGLLVVAGVGPVALACHALPQTDPVAQIWWRSLGGLLAVQVLQAVTLHLAVATLLIPGASLPFLGLPGDPTGVLNLLITCYLLWLVIRIPRWVARTFGGTRGRSGGILGYVVRVVVVQQLLGAVGLRGGRLFGRSGRAAAAATGAGGGGATVTHLHSHANSHLHQHVHLHPGRPWPAQGAAGSARPGAARPHGGRSAASALPAPPAAASRPTVAGPSGPSSGTGWPPAPPSGRRPSGGQPSGTGWPNVPAAARPATPGSRPAPGPGRPPAGRPGPAGSGRSGSGVDRGR